MRSVELFAGAGGLGLGVSSAGFEPVGVVELNKHCCDTLRMNQRAGLAPIDKWPLLERDVRNVTYADFHDVDLVTGGPPCQPFSIGGKHLAYNDSRDLFPEAVRAIRELTPRAFIFENVKGLTRTAFANYFQYIKLQLTYPLIARHTHQHWSEHLSLLEKHHTSSRNSDLTYNVVTRVLDAADYGVPQRRHRVFFVGFRSDLEIEWAFPEATHSKEALLWSQHVSGEYWDEHRVDKSSLTTSVHGKLTTCLQSTLPLKERWRTVRDAISDLPEPLPDEAFNKIANHRLQAGARTYAGHTGSHLDAPAKTLKAGDHGVPGGENMLIRADGSVRYFTVRESARIQTFPDEYRFYGSWTESMRQIGNAVPVVLAAVVAKSVRDQLRLGAKS